MKLNNVLNIAKKGGIGELQELIKANALYELNGEESPHEKAIEEGFLKLGVISPKDLLREKVGIEFGSLEKDFVKKLEKNRKNKVSKNFGIAEIKELLKYLSDNNLKASYRGVEKVVNIKGYTPVNKIIEMSFIPEDLRPIREIVTKQNLEVLGFEDELNCDTLAGSIDINKNDIGEQILTIKLVTPRYVTNNQNGGEYQLHIWMLHFNIKNNKEPKQIQTTDYYDEEFL